MSSGKEIKKSRVRKFKPGSEDPFQVSRSRVQLFLDCKRCFYIQNRLGVKMPKMLPFKLNSLVDTKVKQSFDFAREKQIPHKYFKDNDYNLVPLKHEKIPIWRENFQGLKYHHKKSNLILQGAIDDCVQDLKTKECSAVDYKATQTEDGEKVKYLGAPWHKSWKNQLSIYQYLLEKNELKISKDAYIVFCNAQLDKKEWDNKLNFDVQVIPYEVDLSWIEPALEEIKALLEAKYIPAYSEEDACDNCRNLKENNSLVNSLLEKSLKYLKSGETE